MSCTCKHVCFILKLFVILQKLVIVLKKIDKNYVENICFNLFSSTYGEHVLFNIIQQFWTAVTSLYVENLLDIGQ